MTHAYESSGTVSAHGLARTVVFDGQARGDPIGFALRVIFHVCVAHFRQGLGGVFRGVSRGTGAVDDDLGVLRGGECGRKLLDLTHWNIHCAGQMRVFVRLRRQRLHQYESIVPVYFAFQIITTDCSAHEYPPQRSATALRGLIDDSPRGHSPIAIHGLPERAL